MTPKISVTKLTDVNLLRQANAFTTGRDSYMNLSTAYRHGHSPIRTQFFWVELTDIPLFVASQLVRSHVGIQCYQLSKRPDRGGADFEAECKRLSDKFAQYTAPNPIFSNSHLKGDFIQFLTDMKSEIMEQPKKFGRFASNVLAFVINAEALINNGKMLAVNEDGKHIEGLMPNDAATELAHQSKAIADDDVIVGDVLYCKESQIL